MLQACLGVHLLEKAARTILTRLSVVDVVQVEHRGANNEHSVHEGHLKEMVQALLVKVHQKDPPDITEKEENGKDEGKPEVGQPDGHQAVETKENHYGRSGN